MMDTGRLIYEKGTPIEQLLYDIVDLELKSMGEARPIKLYEKDGKVVVILGVEY